MLPIVSQITKAQSFHLNDNATNLLRSKVKNIVDCRGCGKQSTPRCSTKISDKQKHSKLWSDTGDINRNNEKKFHVLNGIFQAESNILKLLKC